MLDELHVRNIALIEDASIAFAPGLTVLTGETGAGKTALLSALRLVTGMRADSSAVRDGADEAVAEARFIDAEEHVVRRRLSTQGRSRCTIDGSMASVSELAQASSFIRIHSQHEQVQLLHPATQLRYLDEWADASMQHVEQYRNARAAWQEARAQLDALEQASNAQLQELEFLRFTAEQIAAVKPQVGEYEQLEEDLPRLQHGEQLAVAVQTALEGIHADGGALDVLATAGNALLRQAGIDPELDALAIRLDGVQDELADLARDLNSYAETVQFDPQLLEETLDRLGELSGLMKRYGPTMDEVFALWERANNAMEASAASPQVIAAARKKAETAKEAYLAQAEQLSQVRAEAASSFCKQLASAVQELAMEGASFEFAFEALPFERWSDTSNARVELLYRPAPASEARPLARIASGGELSRILLALECMHLATNEDERGKATIVFDEVDQGVGGATGSAVARRIAQLARHAQVIVVTHLAQIAAYADAHYVVSKSVAGELPQTHVTKVTGEARTTEIARMLAGSSEAAAIEHARSLLAGAEVL